MSLCPRSNLLLSLCLLLGLTVSLGGGQTLERIAPAHEPSDTNYTGGTFSITTIGDGSGSFSVPPRPWICYTTGGTTNVIWQLPNGTSLPLVNPPRVAEENEFFYTPHFDGRVILTRGSNRLSPVGEYCCVRTGTTQRLCVTFTLCPLLTPPTNGMVSYSPNNVIDVNHIATYSCQTGYELVDEPNSTCLSDGTRGVWSEGLARPLCKAVDCGPLNITNGQVMTSDGTTFMNTATYSCNTGYTLIGSATRMCGADRMWSPATPTCISIPAIVSSSSGPPMAGQSYSLTCTVTGADSLSPTISYQWTQGQTQVGTNSMVLTFDPLVLSDVGLYRCEASVRSTLLSQDFTAVSDLHQIKFETLNFQLRFNGILNCREYTLFDSGLKTSDITNELVRGVEDLCGCGFNNTFVSNTFLKCFDSPDHVTYRGVVSGTTNISTVEIVSYIDQWTKTTQTLVVQSVGLNINNTCPVAIVNLRNTPECPEASDVRSTTPPTTDPIAVPALGAIIGGVVCGVLVLVIVAAVIVIVLLIVRRQTSTGSLTNQTTEVHVPLRNLPQTSPTPNFQEDEIYEQIGESSLPKRDYDLTYCPAYGRSQTTPIGEREEQGESVNDN